jgi:predicted MFS family arabinose efflux permease
VILFSRTIGAVRASSRPVRAFLLGAFFMGLGLAIFEVLLNLYLQKTGCTKAEIGDILSQRAVGTVFGALAAGSSWQRTRPTLVFVTSACLLALSMVLLILAPTPLLRQATATLYGFSFTFRVVGAPPFLFRQANEAWLATLLGIDAAIMAGTQFIGAAGAGALFSAIRIFTEDDVAAFRGALGVGAALSMACAVTWLGTRAAAPAHDEPRAAAPASTPRPAAMLLFRMCLPFFIIGAGAGLTIPYLNLYFEDRFQAEPSTISYYYAGVALATTAGFLLSPALAERFGIVKSVVFSELCSIPFFVILAYSTSLPISVAAFLMRGALMNLPYPLYGNFIMRAVGAGHREFANGLTKLAWNGSWVVTARVAGALLDKGRGDYTPVMLASAGLYLLASTTFWTFFRKMKF